MEIDTKIVHTDYRVLLRRHSHDVTRAGFSGLAKVSISTAASSYLL